MAEEARVRSSPAVALRVFDYSETSQVVHLYAREFGKIHAIAKGSKRKKSAFHGPFDVLVLYDVQRMEKTPGTLDLLVGAESVRDWRPLRADWPRFAVASYGADLVDEATPEALPQPALFDVLTGFLDALESGAPLADALFRFEARALDQLGHFPRIAECGACGKPPSGPESWYSPRDGGIRCTTCPPADAARVLVKRIVLDGLAAFQAGKPFRIGAYAGFVPELRRLLDLHLKWVLDREPKTLRFLRDALPGS